MDRNQLVLGLAAVFLGLAALSVVAGLAVHPIVLLFAVPFGAVGYLMWYHASGKLEARVRARANERPRDGARRGPRRRPGGVSRRRARQTRRDAVGDEWRTRSGSRGRGSVVEDGSTPREAYRTLGLSPDASDEAIRSAYRRKAKELHPDNADGDQEAFKAVNRAYDRLTD